MKVEVQVAVRDGGGEREPLFTEADMIRIGQAAAAAIVLRTDAGKSADGERDFAAYSETKAWIPRDAFPSPKGGDGESKSGRSVIYNNGYRQYKAQSTGSDRPNLTATGEMLQGYGVVESSASAVEIGPSKPTIGRAIGNQQKRPWMGHTKSTMDELEATVQEVFDSKDLFADGSPPTVKVVP